MRWLSPIAIAAIVMAAVGFLPARAAEAPPPGASSCSGCHPAAAGVPTPVPRLAGVAAAQIETAMAQFRSGTRPATVMNRIAKGFSDAEIAAIAAWYAGQKP
jgi:cytochrome c553